MFQSREERKKPDYHGHNGRQFFFVVARTGKMKHRNERKMSSLRCHHSCLRRCCCLFTFHIFFTIICLHLIKWFQCLLLLSLSKRMATTTTTTKITTMRKEKRKKIYINKKLMPWWQKKNILCHQKMNEQKTLPIRCLFSQFFPS